MQSEKTQITHRGRIVGVGSDSVTIAISASAEECGRCAIASICSRPTEIEVALPGASPSLLGREATIANTTRSHRLATLLFLGAPLALMIAVLCVASLLGASQALAGVLSLGSMLAWYAALLLIRNRLTARAAFQITHLWDAEIPTSTPESWHS
ncbi:MAG: SoxR reducing system RseC family protein [Bacteroidales bacterium]|nr:SoxR reducing system RseC family protein [Bacteroidales bacterium]